MRGEYCAKNKNKKMLILTILWSIFVTKLIDMLNEEEVLCYLSFLAAQYSHHFWMVNIAHLVNKKKKLNALINTLSAQSVQRINIALHILHYFMFFRFLNCLIKLFKETRLQKEIILF